MAELPALLALIVTPEWALLLMVLAGLLVMFQARRAAALAFFLAIIALLSPALGEILGGAMSGMPWWVLALFWVVVLISIMGMFCRLFLGKDVCTHVKGELIASFVRRFWPFFLIGLPLVAWFFLQFVVQLSDHTQNPSVQQESRIHQPMSDASNSVSNEATSSLPAASQSPSASFKSIHVAAPSVDVGDSYTYSIIGQGSFDGNSQETWVVDWVDGDWIMVTVLDAEGQTLSTRTYDKQWNPVRITHPDGAMLAYTPYFPLLEFPLSSEKNWELSVNEFENVSRTEKEHLVEGGFLLEEVIDTAAGQFNSYVVKLDTTTTEAGSEQPVYGDITVWYVPEINAPAKIKTRVIDPETLIVNERIEELIAYKKVDSKATAIRPE